MFGKKNINTSISSKESEGYKDAYLCSLKQIENFISVVNEKDPAAIILITADHGWNINNKILNKKESIKEMTRVYNAIKLDHKCKSNIPDELDTINSFRLIIGCALNKRPIFKKTKVFYGFHENHEEYGKVFNLD